MKKRIIALVLALILIAPAALADVDLSGMTFEELLELQRQVTAAIWASDGWQEVTVPTGVYEVGVDIPAGYWTIRPIDGDTAIVKWGDVLNEIRTDTAWSECTIFVREQITSPTDSYSKYNSVESVSWNVFEGTYIVIEDGAVIFTPFTGHNLGFK